MPTLSKDTTPEEVYELLKSLRNDGIFTYILPTDPLGEEWVCGTNDHQLLKMNHEQVISFLIGNQMTLHWLMAQVQARGVPDWLRPITLSKSDAEFIVKIMDEWGEDRWAGPPPWGENVAGALGLRHRLSGDAREARL